MKNPLPILRRGLYDIGDDVSMPLIRPTRQAQKFVWFSARTIGRTHWALRRQSNASSDCKEASMYFAAAVLAILSGLFYAAGHHEIGSFGVTICRYGSPFCDN